MCLRIPLRISALCLCSLAVKIRTLGLSSLQVRLSSPPRIFLSELQPRTPAADTRNSRRQLVGAYAVSIQGRFAFTVGQANVVSALAQPVAPSDSFWLPSLDPMLSTFAVHPCIFSCLNLSGSTLVAPFRGRGILRLCQLPSLRLRTRTLICSKRLVRC
jgi:hypothetical protein